MKILASEDATALKPWTFPEVQSPQTLAIDDKKNHDAVAQEQQISQELHEFHRQEAIERGYQEGFARGQQAADAEIRAHYEPLWQEKLQLLDHILQQLAKPLAMIDDELEQILTELVTKLTRHLLAHELTIQPEQILRLVKNAIELLPIANRNLRIYVNAEDKILLSQALSTEYVNYLTEDMHLQRGECRFSSDSCELDATVESRLTKLFSLFTKENPDMSLLKERFKNYIGQVSGVKDLCVQGRLTRVIGLKLEAVGFTASLGTKCLIAGAQGKKIEAEVVGFSGDILFLMSADNTQGVTPGAIVTPLNHSAEVAVGPELLGRILDGAGCPLDNKPVVKTSVCYPLIGNIINPLSRYPIREPLDVGIRAINALLTVGRGQRIGLFAGSGVGKSVLLSMMTRFTAADIIVVGLIGERGREVKEFIEDNLGPAGLARAVVIAAPADTSPLMRLQGAMWATTIAEYFRDQGAKVLLLIDSLTRFAQAQRELSLSIGEPPTTKGYSPSVFSKLSQLVERAGNDTFGRGSITAFYTVLVEGDDQNDPIADAARSILDGHIVLTRNLADSGHYPAIDIEASISRVMPAVISKEHQVAAQAVKSLYSQYQQNRDLIKVGAYKAGSDPVLEKSLVKMPSIVHFLQQGIDESVDFAHSVSDLYSILDETNIPPQPVDQGDTA